VDEDEGGTDGDAPALGLSEEVFTDSAEAEPAPELSGEAEPESSDGAAPDLTEESVEADQVAPEEQGPGDSEGGQPASPEEEEAT
jgi:hypothetical protein